MSVTSCGCVRFVLFLMFLFVRAMFCDSIFWPVYIVKNILSLNNSSFYFVSVLTGLSIVWSSSGQHWFGSGLIFVGSGFAPGLGLVWYCFSLGLG